MGNQVYLTDEQRIELKSVSKHKQMLAFNRRPVNQPKQYVLIRHRYVSYKQHRLAGSGERQIVLSGKLVPEYDLWEALIPGFRAVTVVAKVLW